ARLPATVPRSSCGASTGHPTRPKRRPTPPTPAAPARCRPDGARPRGAVYVPSGGQGPGMGRSTGMRVAVLRSMPPAEQIVASLSALASSAFAVGVLWHGVAAVIAFALWRGWRPRARDAAALLALPLASVAALAW